MVVEKGLKNSSSFQCNRAASKAMHALGLIKQVFQHQISIKAIQDICPPHLEQCVQIWSFHLFKDIDILEKIQDRAIKLIPSIAGLSYEMRLKHPYMLDIFVI